MVFCFLVNIIVGLGGFFDFVIVDFVLFEQDIDFGQIFVVWGIFEGVYLELLLLGFLIEWDVVGKVVDLVVDLMGVVLNCDQCVLGFGVWLVGKVGEWGEYGDMVDFVFYDSVDSYVQMWLIWLQYCCYEFGEEGEVIDFYVE